MNPVPHSDAQRRTCLLLERNDVSVRCIPLDVVEGLAVVELAADDFDLRFKPLVDYPAERMARLYVSYATSIGATEAALRALGRLTTIHPQEHDMATRKKAAKAATAVTKKPATVKGGKKKKAAKPARKTTDKTTARAEGGARRETAAQLFQDLIRAGTLTDDQIFAKVQGKFGLSDDKRSYVAWYRNRLRKNGEKVPDAKV